MHGVTRRRNQNDAEIAKLKKVSELYEEKTTKILNKNIDDLNISDLSEIGESLNINPENSTLWNMRKRIILEWLSEQNRDTTDKLEQSESAVKLPNDMPNEVSCRNNSDEISNMFSSELRFSAVCISRNPKSYASWFHRRWCLQTMPNAPLQSELDVCKEYLSRDERNFHCWAYWYFLTTEMNLLDCEQCFAFVTEKLIENFSNYSAWHYRSILLSKNPKLKYSSAGERELLHNAFFTDPSDQSAWFYHRWILKLNSPSLTPVRIAIRTYENKISKNVDICFNKPIDIKDIMKSTAYQWVPLPNPEIRNVAWTFTVHKDDIELVVTTHRKNFRLDITKDQYLPFPQIENSTDEDEELRLLKRLLDIEPESKWVNLAYLTLLQRNPNTLFECIQERLHKLISIDPLRINYYNDLKSKIIMQYIIRNIGEQTKIKVERQLTKLYYTQYLYFVTELDLSSCRNICNLSGIELCQRLQILNVSSNQISSAPLEIAKCPCLKKCVLTDNPLPQNEIEKIKKECVNLELIF